MSELLRIKGLAKSFGRKPVLKDFDLTVESGRVYGLLGCNGEGKTTLARILMGVIPADGGEIFYKGRRITYGQSAYKRDFGYVPEDPFFYEDMTVRAPAGFQRPLLPEVGPEAGRGRPRALRPRSEGAHRDALARAEAQARPGRGPGRRPRIPHPRRPDLGPGRAHAPGLPPGRHPRAGRFGHDRPLRHPPRPRARAHRRAPARPQGGRLILDEDFDKVKATHQASLEDIFCRLVAGA